MRLILFVVLVGGAFAQTTATPEIRGLVTEHGTNAPVVGAQVLLSEFVVVDGTVTRKPVMSVFTGNQGDFQFRPDHVGRFWVEASKSGYELALPTNLLNGISETSIEVTSQRPTATTKLMLFRPGRLTGRVVDEDGNPVANVWLHADIPNLMSPRSITADTDTDGVFTFDALPSGPRVVKAGPRTGGEEEATDEFTEDDLKKIDRDFEVSYWPGGVAEQRMAIPIDVIPGVTASLGTIRLHRVPYYSAHFTLAGECEPNSFFRWHFRDAADNWSLVRLQSAECHKELLFRMLRPGPRMLALYTVVGRDTRSWALIPINIKDENIEATFSPAPSEDIPVLWTLDGKPTNKIGNLRIALQSIAGLNQFMDNIQPDAQGNMTLHGIVFPRQQVSFLSSDPKLAVKEIRYNYRPVLDGMIDVVHDALLEILLDDRPASIAVTAMDRDKPAARAVLLFAKWPLSEALAFSPIQFPYFLTTATNLQGKGILEGLGAGEYRLAAVAEPVAGLIQDPSALRRLLTQGQKITLERGEQKNIEVKLTDTSR